MKKNLPLNKYFKTNISDIQNNSSLHLLWKLTFLFFQEIFLQPLVVMGTMWCTCNKIFKSWAAFKCISPKKKKNRNVSGVVFKNVFLAGKHLNSFKLHRPVLLSLLSGLEPPTTVFGEQNGSALPLFHVRLVSNCVTWIYIQNKESRPRSFWQHKPLFCFWPHFPWAPLLSALQSTVFLQLLSTVR